jgi:hypothetical protein
VTVSTHVYSLVVAGPSGDQPLHVLGGQVTLDDGQAPHVQATLTVIGDPAVLALLDPRTSPPPRCKLTVTATFPGRTQSRTFDLTLRTRDTSQDDGSTRITLASDEALLGDWAPLADDTGTFAHTASLRDLVNYVMGKVIILRRNLFLNPWSVYPAGVIAVNGELTPSNASGQLRVTHNVGATAGSDYLSHPIAAITAGQTYGIRLNLANVSGALAVSITLRDSGFNVLVDLTPSRTVNGTTWTYTGTYTAPTPAPTGLQVIIDVLNAGTGEAFTLAQSICEPGVTVAGPYFDGGSDPANGSTWEGAAYASASRWNPVVSSTPSDPNMKPLSPSTNIVRNPRVLSNTTDWAVTWTTGGAVLNRFATGGPADAPSYVQLYQNQASGGATGVYLFLSENSIGVTPGVLYRLTVYVALQNVSTAVNVDAILYDAAGNIVAFATPATVPAGSTGWQRVTVTFYALSNVTKIRPRVNVPTFAYGAYLGVTGWRLSESNGDPGDVGFFDGSTAASADYTYNYPAGGTAGAAISNRVTARDAPAPAAILWPAGKTAIDYLGPLLEAKGLRLVCDEARVWTLRDTAYSAPGSLVIRYGVNMESGQDTIDRAGGQWYDAAITRYSWNVPGATSSQSFVQVDAFALKTPYSRAETFEKNIAYPGAGDSQYVVRRAQGRGREVRAVIVADWGARCDQFAQIAVPGAPTQTGTVQALAYDLDTDSLRVTARTIDTPAGAIDLLQGTIDALIGTIDAQRGSGQ